MSIPLYISLRTVGLIGRTWKGVRANLRFSPCMVVSNEKEFDGKGWSRAACKYFTPPSTFLQCSYPQVTDISSMKRQIESSEAGNKQNPKKQAK